MSIVVRQLEGHSWSFWSCWRPRKGYEVGGDFCYLFAGKKSVIAAVVDVLGHGEEAYKSARELLKTLQNQEENELEVLFKSLEGEASRNRGCALFLASFSPFAIRYIMVGNMKGWLLKESCKVDLLFSQPGVVGGRKMTPTIRETGLAGVEGLIVCSDGIRRGFVPTSCSATLNQGEERLALYILEKYGIPEDDASVLIGRRRK
ncbi:protein serine/threonine phosphatase [Ammonifex degensii KC4]|uniref:Protein serine/threonine phosphatase n=1 Tax=Ammonifex degensii (strain DSM 10501 / KC4) TaxID=429009 RepID=C9R9C1_AMMDK|nr:protein-serine/threonine phosphatase [Ammonifex degensii]ACX52900.1 protein serine/threonine phosphatase [Ammonifex degensii KC4]